MFAAGNACVVHQYVQVVDRAGSGGNALVRCDIEGNSERVDARSTKLVDRVLSSCIVAAPTPTLIPCIPSPCAIAKPIPLLAPVISAVFVVMRSMVGVERRCVQYRSTNQ